MRVFVLVCAIVVIGAAGAAVAERPRAVPPLVDEMLKLSGVTRQLAQLPDAIIEGFGQRAAQLDARTAETQRKILRESYRPDALYPILVAAVTERYDERQARAVVQAFQTPLFRRLQALEEVAVGPDAAARIRAFSERLVDNRPSVERHVLIRRLDTAMGATSVQLEMMGATIQGLSSSMGAGAPNREQVRGIMAGVQEQGVVPMKNHVLLSLLFAYQTVGDDELRDYLAFWESSAGRWFVTTVSTGLVQAVARAAETAGRRMKATGPGGKRE
jgi:hypothetical protein